ncbi:MAG: hypothetical protein BWX95_01510 [Bacteroidetes bacterium ADurb.Bin141]|nr:DUF4271 domain-containing protein [Bacteroidota bacterium]OQB62248.1 MAG: hypothetical protein BWX95_01510 [Bacteroidetes bacterium ADurb.Bin141]
MSTGQIISKDSSNSAAKISVDGTHQLHQIISGIAKTDSVLKSGDTTAIADSGKTASDSASAVATFRFVDEENTDLTANEISFLPSSSYLGSHVLNVHSRSPVSYSKPVPDWYAIVLLVLIAGITVIKVFYHSIFRQMISALYNFAVTNQVVRDENMLVQRASILLNAIFYGGAGLFLYWVSMKLSWNNPIINHGLLRFFFFAFVTAVFFSVKMLLLKFIGWVFGIDKQISVYVFSIFLANNAIGVVLVATAAAMAYLTEFSFVNYLWLVLATVATAFLYLFYRAILISRSIPGFRLYYLFLYFCTLEIVPLILIIKLTIW